MFWLVVDHFSQNWGFITLSPVMSGYLFSYAFGKNLDAHGEPHVNPEPSTVASASVALVKRSLLPAARMVSSLMTRGGGVSPPTDAAHQCLDGRICYSDSIWLTIVACLMAFGLSLNAGYRDWKIRGKTKDYEVIWNDEAVEGDERP